MKRDMDLIRLLLIQVETSEEPRGMDQYPEEERAYNAALLIEAGLVKGTVVPNAEGGIHAAVITRLTWEGHDFLDAARSETVWTKAREKVLKPGLSWTFSMLLEFLKAEAQAQMQKHGLLPPQ